MVFELFLLSFESQPDCILKTRPVCEPGSSFIKLTYDQLRS